jgi:hypothetical protein
MATRTAQVASSSTDYQVPVVHVRVPQRLGDAVFWVGVAGAVAAGAVELPVAALVAAGVVVMRHRSNAP